jgi:hypothetical protein
MTGIVGAPGTQVTRTDGVSLGCCSVPVFARTGTPDSGGTEQTVERTVERSAFRRIGRVH